MLATNETIKVTKDCFVMWHADNFLKLFENETIQFVWTARKLGERGTMEFIFFQKKFLL